jgi:hypothetical protein
MIMQNYESRTADEAAKEPLSLFTKSIGDSDETRDTGLILTKEQIKHLKRYEMAGLALPTELKDVIAYLSYETGAGKGLEAVDCQKSFRLIHGHASLWNPLRTDLLTVSDKLAVFAGTIQVHGRSIAEVFDDVRALGLVEEHNIETLADLQRVEQELGIKFPPISKVDRNDIAHFLDEILAKVLEREAEANRIKIRLDAFGKQLAARVIPEIKLRLATIDNNSLGSEIMALQTKIDARAKDIDEKNKEYKQLVKEAIGGVTQGGLILVIYLSVTAEKIRKERNKLQEQQAADIDSMESKNRILASLNRVRSDFQDLDLIVVDADIATKNLITVWNKMSTFIAESSGEIHGLHDGLSLRRFKNKFNLVVKPWETIEKDAYALLAVFAQADAEFREEYGDIK